MALTSARVRVSWTGKGLGQGLALGMRLAHSSSHPHSNTVILLRGILSARFGAGDWEADAGDDDLA